MENIQFSTQYLAIIKFHQILTEAMIFKADELQIVLYKMEK